MVSTEALPLGQILTELAAEAPHRPIVTCGARTVTRAQLERMSNQLARTYRQLGVEPGDFVTVALPNSIEYYAATFAVWKLGAVPQQISPRLPRIERAAILELAAPALVLGMPRGSHGDLETLPAGYAPDPDVSDAPIEPVTVPPAWKAPTSGGSTGRPKLIVSGQAGAFDPRANARMLGQTENGAQLVPGPLYHNAPFTSSMYGLFIGQHQVVLPKFDPITALDSIRAFRVDWVSLVPTMMLRMYREIIQHPRRFDVSSLKALWHMAAPCPNWLKEAWIDLIGAEKVHEVYGGTENQMVTHIAGIEWLQHRGSVGRPLYGEFRILDHNGREVPAGEIGEIYMRPSPDAEPTYRYIGDEARSRDGWESIGDLGWQDDDGFLYISDRRTDLILSGGANVYPAEVESAIMSHPRVATCAVVGLSDPDLGQRVHALVQANGPLAEAELLKFLSDRLVRYKIPRSIRFTAEPVRDEAGKVRRAALREREEARNDRSVKRSLV